MFTTTHSKFTDNKISQVSAEAVNDNGFIPATLFNSMAIMFANKAMLIGVDTTVAFKI